MLKNELVELIYDIDRYLIYHNGIIVGYLTLNDTYVYILINKLFRSNHYATNALYLFTKYAHEVLNIKVLKAIIQDDMSKHVFEHCGYHLDKDIYIHDINVTIKNDQEKENVIYLAGGCFWGMEKVFQTLKNVISTEVGYVNGNTINPTYEDVCRANTGYKECVKVIYKDNLKLILDAYFMCIDPTIKNRQGNDIGNQYQTGIYYVDKYEEIKEYYEKEKSKYQNFYVELEPLKSFYKAEEYHQNYLNKNPGGYCHITKKELDKVKELNKD